MATDLPSRGISHEPEGLSDILIQPSNHALDQTPSYEHENYIQSDIGSESESMHNIPTNFHVMKRNRLRNLYSEEYLELFNETYQDISPSWSSDQFKDNLPPSTIGVLRWTSSEKGDLFTNLTRCGVINNPSSLSVSSRSKPSPKSVIEIQQFQDILRTSNDNRQRYKRNPRHINAVDIPAAIEIGPECEVALEGKADVLSAFQEHFDFIVGQRTWGQRWEVDHHVAKVLDNISDLDNGQEDDNDESNNKIDIQQQSAKLFHLSKFLDLSERLFMNMPDTVAFDHWEKIAEQNQRPSLTQEVVEELHNLVVNLTRRIMQSSIFLAKSRIRSMTSTNYKPSNLVSREDVSAALNVLNLPHDSWDFWTSYARRSGARIILGTKEKGRSNKQQLSIEQVESALSGQNRRGRRRSLSSLVDTESSMSTETDDTNQDDTSEQMEVAELSETEYPVVTSIEANTSEVANDVSLDHGHSDDSADAPSEASIGNSDAYNVEDSDNTSQISTKNEKETNMNGKSRCLDIEDEEDEYLEQLDQGSRNAEEARLWQLLSKSSTVAYKQIDLQNRPKTIRKSKRDLEHWTDGLEYMAAWEHECKRIRQQELN